jgi:CheY-like chemotaxis protein
VQAVETSRPLIGMPTLKAYETARRIRKEPCGKNVVLVALARWRQEEDRRKSDEAGFDARTVKPIDPAVLKNLLANLRVNSA